MPGWLRAPELRSLTLPEYRRQRIGTALRRFLPREEEAARTAASALVAGFGWTPEQSPAGGRRYELYRRDLLLHESLLLDLPPDDLDQLLDDIRVVGLEGLAHVPANHGLLLLSAHFWLFSSWLWLWLVRAAERGLMPSLDVAMDSRGNGFGLPQATLAGWRAAGLCSPQTSRILDTSKLGGAGAAHTMRHALQSRQAVLLFPDLHQAGHATAELAVGIGNRRVSIPAGLEWLVAESHCSIASVHIRPDGDGHAIVFGQPVLYPSTHDAVSVLQRVLDETANGQPALYAPLIGLTSVGR